MTPDADDDTLAEQLFEAARRDRPAPSVKHRVLRAVSTPRPAPRLSRWLLAALAVGAVVALVVLVDRATVLHGDGAAGDLEPGVLRAEPVVVSSRFEQAAAEPEASASVRRESLEAPPPSSSAAVVPIGGAVSKRPPASLEQELKLLDAARQALLRGDTGAALKELSHYDEVASRRHLGAEASVLRIQILAASGRAAEASRLASEFVAKHPNSPLVDRAKSFIQKQGVGP